MSDAFDPISFLVDQGVEREVIDRSIDEGWMPMLVVERIVRPGPRIYSKEDTARLGGVSVDLADRLWRALGFPDAPSGEPMFTEDDVATITLARERLSLGDEADRHVQQARVISGATARIAELYTDALVRLAYEAADEGMTPEQIAAEIPSLLDLDVIAGVMDYVLRHQIVASMWRRVAMQAGPDHVEHSIGFADLVGYTALSQELTADELTTLVSTFESVTADTIAEGGGRVVKRIGDAVMFSVNDPVSALKLSLALVEALEDAGMAVRVGLAHGPVVPHEGDLFGPSVNLASRLQTMARPGSVVIGESIHVAVADREDIELRPMGRRRVKDIGMHRLWRVRRSGERERRSERSRRDDRSSKGAA